MSAIAPPSRPFRIDVHIAASAAGAALAEDALRGLTAPEKWLPPKYFYDDAGSRLFEAITQTPEYYQTRTELTLLRDLAPGLAARHGSTELVELGSGSSRKTRALLDAMQDAGTLRRYLPFDICPEALLAAAGPLMDAYPGMRTHGVAGDFELHLDRVPARRRRGRRVVAFLGSTIGNLRPEQRASFLRSVAELLGPDDILLLGTDLVGDRERLEAAYDDAEGITAAFNRNVLAVLNRELRADFDLDRFQHVARWCPEPAWIEMRLRALTPHEVRLDSLGLELSFAEGEDILTELSCKFTRESVTAMYDEAGLELREWHLDPLGWYAVSVASRAGADPLA